MDAIKMFDGLAPYVTEMYSRAIKIFIDRSKRYGTDNISDTGIHGMVSRLRDKLARLETTLDNGSSDAAIDTALDIANYGIMTAAVAAGNWPGSRRACLIRELGFPNICPPAIDGDVGFDLRAYQDIIIRPNRINYVPTGVAIMAPRNTWTTLMGRSSLLKEYGAFVPENVIDCKFTGELQVPVISLMNTFTIKTGERFAQIVFRKAIVPEIKVVKTLPTTTRGENSFGSTGK